MIEVNSVGELNKVVDCIKNSGKNIIILSGNLGSGKTTLVKEFVKSLGIDESVTSPTFSLQNVYSNKVYHYDLYNKTKEDFLALGLLEELEKEGYHFLEWGEELEDILRLYGLDFLRVNISVDGKKRIFECQN